MAIKGQPNDIATYKGMMHEAIDKGYLAMLKELVSWDLRLSVCEESLNRLSQFATQRGRREMLPVIDRLHRRKRALVIGVRYGAKKDRIRGTWNDAKAMRDILRKQYEYSDITLLTDEEYAEYVTKNYIQKEIAKLIETTTRGDRLVLYFGGHGREETWRSEAGIAPYDHHIAGTITRSWLKEQLNRLPRGSQMTIIVDACHSG